MLLALEKNQDIVMLGQQSNMAVIGWTDRERPLDGPCALKTTSRASIMGHKASRLGFYHSYINGEN